MKTDNELIAEFMGFTRRASSKCFNIKMNGKLAIASHLHESHFKYDTSWDWLMPVVEKIEILNYSVTLYTGGCQIFHKGIAHGTFHSCETKIESVYKAVLEFIKWYQNAKIQEDQTEA